MRKVFFGAFDRHNLGDILLAHVAAHGVENPCFAGLAERDLTPWSGPRVVTLESIEQPMHLFHVGGELLDCDAAQAAYMLEEPALHWQRRAPYVVARAALPPGSCTYFCAVGGVGLGQRDDAFRAEVLAALTQASSLSVRDRTTQRLLAASGVVAALEPDPVARIAQLFGEKIRERTPRKTSYVAVQFAAECGDDQTLAEIAAGLNRIGLPVVLFRAGIAPWHDAIEPFQRLASRLRVPSEVFMSVDVWDICGLIAHSRGFIGTSLHARIVAESFAVPALSLACGSAAEKVRAYVETWLADRAMYPAHAFADAAVGLLAL